MVVDGGVGDGRGRHRPRGESRGPPPPPQLDIKKSTAFLHASYLADKRIHETSVLNGLSLGETHRLDGNTFSIANHDANDTLVAINFLESFLNNVLLRLQEEIR